jgi:ParB/RepB/Spo0J family partition protein
MSQHIQKVPIDKLIAHPDNPNRMSDKTFTKLVRNIERTGRYEPIIVRPKGDSYEIINGHHRVKALRQLGIKTAEIVIWDVNNEETDIFLTTLNRLSGSDELDKKLAILRRLNEKMRATELAKLLPFNSKQIERLKEFKLPAAPAKIEQKSFTHPLVFFINKEQKQIIEKAIHEALHRTPNGVATNNERQTKAAALAHIAQTYIARNEKKGSDTFSDKNED